MRSRHIALACLALVLALTGVGYGSAWLARERCADVLFAEISARNVRGITMGGEHVSPTRDAVHAEVTGLFEVTASTALPRDLHAVVYTKRFRVWPFGFRAQQTKEDYTV